MSRVASQPVNVPSGVEVTVSGRAVTVKGPKGTLEHRLHDAVDVERNDDALNCSPRQGAEISIACWLWPGIYVATFWQEAVGRH